MPKSGSYFICRAPLVKKWSVSFNHVSRSKVKAIGNSVKFLSGAYILSLWPNQAILYPESACWKILCNCFKPRFYVKSLGKNISLNFYIFSFPLWTTVIVLYMYFTHVCGWKMCNDLDIYFKTTNKKIWPLGDKNIYNLVLHVVFIVYQREAQVSLKCLIKYELLSASIYLVSPFAFKCNKQYKWQYSN